MISNKDLRREIDNFLRDSLLNSNQKPSMKTNSLSESQNYCRKMLLKKKLNPYTKNEKMERIFKDFKDVGTYIDIPQLHKQLKYIILKVYQKKKIQKKEKDKMSKKEKELSKVKTESKINQDCHKCLQQKINMLYGKKREKYFRHDLILIEDLIKDLDMKKVISKQVHLEEQDYEKFLQNCMEQKDIKKIQNCQKKNFRQQISKLNLTAKESLEIQKILQRIATYLMIKLTNVHKQKWISKTQPKKIEKYVSLHEEMKTKFYRNSDRKTFHFTFSSLKKQEKNKPLTNKSRRHGKFFENIKIPLGKKNQEKEKQKMLQVQLKQQDMTPEKVKKIKKYNARDFYLNKLKNLMKKLSEEQNINDKDKIEMKKYLNKIELTWQQSLPELKKIFRQISQKITTENISFKSLNPDLYE